MDGASDGAFVDTMLGSFDGAFVGALLGSVDGAFVGASDGPLDGALVGALVAALLGALVGAFVGALLGSFDGVCDAPQQAHSFFLLLTTREQLGLLLDACGTEHCPFDGLMFGEADEDA